ncbi:Reverse transcriptase (RNA-dependent DNA polymerase) [Spironucleus salmonicida]|uniref:Reverse transcriptase (RNA-dependent DNA polymerase) n=1 Tax=Spironucleus salmonicida TaxID=348837 RepID=A0A9P8RZW7_9EUKA|nr:Reverse transcriptase (RNA-dependent DNA polymerase) [Spironucleus salmonicida]
MSGKGKGKGFGKATDSENTSDSVDPVALTAQQIRIRSLFKQAPALPQPQPQSIASHISSTMKKHQAPPTSNGDPSTLTYSPFTQVSSVRLFKQGQASREAPVLSDKTNKSIMSFVKAREEERAPQGAPDTSAADTQNRAQFPSTQIHGETTAALVNCQDEQAQEVASLAAPNAAEVTEQPPSSQVASQEGAPTDQPSLQPESQEESEAPPRPDPPDAPDYGIDPPIPRLPSQNIPVEPRVRPQLNSITRYGIVHETRSQTRLIPETRAPSTTESNEHARPRNPDKPFECQACTFASSDPTSLLRHHALTRGGQHDIKFPLLRYKEVYEDPKLFRFYCGICNHPFTKKLNVMLHLMDGKCKNKQGMTNEAAQLLVRNRDVYSLELEEQLAKASAAKAARAKSIAEQITAPKIGLPPEATINLSPLGCATDKKNLALRFIQMKLEIENGADILDAFNQFIGAFRRKQACNTRRDTNQKQIDFCFQRGQTGKAWNLIKENQNKQNLSPENASSRPDLVRELFQENRKPEYESASRQGSVRTALQAPTAEEITKIILQYRDGKAGGPSGILPAHLKELEKSHHISNILAKVYKLILDTPSLVNKTRRLFEYRIIFIPKNATKFRPICIQELFLQVLHKALAEKMKQQLTLGNYQFAFTKNALLRAKYQANIMLKNGLTLTSLDVRNAFNAVPHKVIEEELVKAGLAPETNQYIQAFLMARNAEGLERLGTGVPQGDPLSMMLFCVVMRPILDRLAGKYKVIASYADDVLIGHDSGVNLKDCESVFADYGLTLSVEKCITASPTQAIKFVGQEFKDKPIPLTDHLLQTAQDAFLILEQSKLGTTQQRFQMFVQCIVPSVNYGPLVDVTDDQEAGYTKIDDSLVATTSLIAGLSIKIETLLDSQIRGGMNVITPGRFYPLMTAARDEFHENNHCVFRNIREKIKELVPDDPDPGRPMIFPCILGATRLPGQSVQYLLNSAFGPVATPSKTHLCTLCGTPKIGDHDQKCNRNSGIRIVRHNKAVSAAMNCLAKYEPREITRQQAPEGKFYPDFRIIVSKILTVDLDVTFTSQENMDAKFAEKVRKHKLPDPNQTIIPMVISHELQIHRETLKLLKFHFPEFNYRKFMEAVGTATCFYRQDSVRNNTARQIIALQDRNYGLEEDVAIRLNWRNAAKNNNRRRQHARGSAVAPGP